MGFYVKNESCLEKIDHNLYYIYIYQRVGLSTNYSLSDYLFISIIHKTKNSTSNSISLNFNEFVNIIF